MPAAAVCLYAEPSTRFGGARRRCIPSHLSSPLSLRLCMRGSTSPPLLHVQCRPSFLPMSRALALLATVPAPIRARPPPLGAAPPNATTTMPCSAVNGIFCPPRVCAESTHLPTPLHLRPLHPAALLPLNEARARFCLASLLHARRGRFHRRHHGREPPGPLGAMRLPC